jgi:hypothetical protein
MEMIVSFMTALPEKQADSSAWMQALPRPMRKTLRLTKPRQRNVNTHDGVDDYLAMDCRDEFYLTQNTVNHDPLHDEFGDIDDEYEGLTITEPMNEVDTFNYLTGYDII